MRVVPRLAALAILVAGAVHLDLWAASGYRSIHVIGPLFLANAIVAAWIGPVLLLRPMEVAALAGIAYAATTLAAFFVSVYVGLFGFVEVLSGTPQLVAGAAEVAAILLLGDSVVQRHAYHRTYVRRRRASAVARAAERRAATRGYAR